MILIIIIFVVRRLDVFSIHTDGKLHVQGMHVYSGGMEIESGGLMIASGGLQVHGGFTLASGDFSVEHNSIHADSFISSTKSSVGPILHGMVESPYYRYHSRLVCG